MFENGFNLENWIRIGAGELGGKYDLSNSKLTSWNEKGIDIDNFKFIYVAFFNIVCFRKEINIFSVYFHSVQSC